MTKEDHKKLKNYIFEFLKKVVSILLIFLFSLQAVSPNMDICCELTKLPAVFTHFQEHKAVDGDSFLEFLDHHVFVDHGDEHKSHSGQDHEDLPFGGKHQCSHAPMAFLTIYFQDFSGPKYFKNTEIESYFSLMPVGFSTSPFQPPRV